MSSPLGHRFIMHKCMVSTGAIVGEGLGIRRRPESHGGDTATSTVETTPDSLTVTIFKVLGT